jgi:hypothetical protein
MARSPSIPRPIQYWLRKVYIPHLFEHALTPKKKRRYRRYEEDLKFDLTSINGSVRTPGFNVESRSSAYVGCLFCDLFGSCGYLADGSIQLELDDYCEIISRSLRSVFRTR